MNFFEPVKLNRYQVREPTEAERRRTSDRLELTIVHVRGDKDGRSHSVERVPTLVNTSLRERRGRTHRSSQLMAFPDFTPRPKRGLFGCTSLEDGVGTLSRPDDLSSRQTRLY